MVVRKKRAQNQISFDLGETFLKGGVGEGKRSLLDRGAGRLLSKKKKRNVFIIMCVYLPIK